MIQGADLSMRTIGGSDATLLDIVASVHEQGDQDDDGDGHPEKEQQQ